MSTFRSPGKSASLVRNEQETTANCNTQLSKIEVNSRELFSNTRLQCSNCVQRNNANGTSRVISAECTVAHLFIGAQSTASCVCVRCLASRANTKSHSACRTSHLHQLRRNLRRGRNFHSGTGHLKGMLATNKPGNCKNNTTSFDFTVRI